MNETFKIFLSLLIVLCMLLSCNEKKVVPKTDFVLANGQMADIIKDKNGKIHLVYGAGDSILYISSSDKGATFLLLHS